VGFAQRRLWFIERLGTAEGVYTVAHAVRLRGPLDRAALAGAIADLFARHAPLRTVFPERDGEPIAIVRPPGEAPLENLGRFPSLEVAVAALVATRARPFEISRARRSRASSCARWARRTIFSASSRITSSATAGRCWSRRAISLPCTRRGAIPAPQGPGNATRRRWYQYKPKHANQAGP
jgi:hypothetical protein